MQRRLLFSFLALTALAAVLGAADRASAAIRITLNDGTNEKVFYSTSSRMALFSTDLGEYEVLAQITVSNFPGTSAGGSLTQLISVSDDVLSVSTLPTLTITSEVINAVGGLGTGFVTDTDLLASVRAAAPARFTLPASGELNVSSKVTGNVSTGPTAGTVQNSTDVNGTLVASDIVTINSGNDGQVELNVDNTDDGYTLISEVVFEGGLAGLTQLGITATSTVTASADVGVTPEPASIVIWSLGGLGLAIAGAFRYRRRPFP